MASSEILPAPDLSSFVQPEDKWRREHQAFLAMLPELLKTYPGKIVAVHNGQVVDIGEDVVSVALRAYEVHGYVPIYVGPVSAKPAVERLTIRRPIEQ
jgi:hypothetical protein